MNEGSSVGRKRTVRDWEDDDRGMEQAEVASSRNVNTNNLENREGVFTVLKMAITIDLATDELQAMLADQIEFEIALRKRVAKVVEARIKWAEQLKDSLVRGMFAIS
jgi:hypothetical protein